MSRKSIKKSFQRSAEYSAALVFGVLFLFSSIYSLPNYSLVKTSSTNNNDSKNLKTVTKVDSSYRKYCASSGDNDTCDFISINSNILDLDLGPNSIISNYTERAYYTKIFANKLIRTPPALIV